MSAHFSVLLAAELIKAEKHGRSITYRLKMTVFEEALLGFAQTSGLQVTRKAQGTLGRKDRQGEIMSTIPSRASPVGHALIVAALFVRFSAALTLLAPDHISSERARRILGVLTGLLVVIFNARSGTVIAVALTSQEPRAGFPLTIESAARGLTKRSWIKISQIRTLATERIGKRIARATDEELGLVIEGLSEIVG